MKIHLHIHTLTFSGSGKTITRRFKHIPTSIGLSKTRIEDSDGEIRFISNEGFKYVNEEEFIKIK